MTPRVKQAPGVSVLRTARPTVRSGERGFALLVVMLMAAAIAFAFVYAGPALRL